MIMWQCWNLFRIHTTLVPNNSAKVQLLPTICFLCLYLSKMLYLYTHKYKYLLSQSSEPHAEETVIDDITVMVLVDKLAF